MRVVLIVALTVAGFLAGYTVASVRSSWSVQDHVTAAKGEALPALESEAKETEDKPTESQPKPTPKSTPSMEPETKPAPEPMIHQTGFSKFGISNEIQRIAREILARESASGKFEEIDWVAYHCVQAPVNYPDSEVMMRPGDLAARVDIRSTDGLQWRRGYLVVVLYKEGTYDRFGLIDGRLMKPLFNVPTGPITRANAANESAFDMIQEAAPQNMNRNRPSGPALPVPSSQQN